MTITTPKPVIHSVPGSQFSVRVIWALESFGVDYEQQLFTPVTETLIKWKHKPEGKVTFPCMVENGKLTRHGLTILEYFNDKDEYREKLFPSALREEVGIWDDISSNMVCHQRGTFFTNAAKDPNLITVILPPFIQAIPPLARFVGGVARKQLSAKYEEETCAATPESVKAGLDKLKARLASTGSDYLVGDKFSYADCAMVTAITALSLTELPNTFALPGIDKFEALADYPEIMAWQDRMIAKHYAFKEGETYVHSA